MPIGARRVAGLALTAVVAGTITAAGFTSASAAPSSCADVDSLHGSALKSCRHVLDEAAERAGKVAAKADEHYLKAQQATAKARAELKSLDTAADAAAVQAARSRARAAVVAAHLARTGGSVGQTTEVLLSGRSAGTVLYHLSRMSELSSDTSRVADQAVRDSRAADRLQQQASDAADELVTEEQAAKAAYESAKKASDAARALVVQVDVKRSGGSKADEHALTDLPPNASTAQKVVAFARAQIGDPYVFGAAGPNSWDCSGLTMMAFQAAGIGIGGHGATVQYTTARSRGLLVPYGEAEAGDLVFYGGGGDMYHVAVYSGGGNMIEAPYPGKSVREVPVRSAGRAPLVARFTG